MRPAFDEHQFSLPTAKRVGHRIKRELVTANSFEFNGVAERELGIIGEFVTARCIKAPMVFPEMGISQELSKKLDGRQHKEQVHASFRARKPFNIINRITYF